MDHCVLYLSNQAVDCETMDVGETKEFCLNEERLVI
jgi:hypothetical protein